MMWIPPKYLRNFLSLSASEIIVRALNFIVFAFIARKFTVGEFGIINLFNAVLTYFFLIINFGYDVYGTRETAKDTLNSGMLLNVIITQKLVSAFFAFSIYIVYSFTFVPGEYQVLSLLFGISIFTNILNLSWFFRGLEKMGVIFISRLVESLLFLSSILILIFINRSLFIVPLFMAISQAAGGFYYFKQLPGSLNHKINFDKYQFWNLLKNSSVLGITSFFALIYLNIDLIMINYLKNDYDTGIYSAAGKIFALGTLPLHLILASFFPELSRLNVNDPVRLKKIINKYFTAIITSALLISVLFFFFPEFILTVIYGNQYISSAQPLKILSATIFFAGLSMAFSGPLVAWGKQKNNLIAVIAGAVLNMILNFLFIPKFSYTGAAYSTLAAEMVVFIILFFFFRKYITKKPDFL